MTSRPILFKGAMVRALLSGAKTQTRRICKPQPVADTRFVGGFYLPKTKQTNGSEISVEAPYVHIACPYGQPGDQLWVRESGLEHRTTQLFIHDATPGRWWTPKDGGRYGASYSADIPRSDFLRDHRVRPSIHMPRWASRITLEIVSERVERLQDISEADAKAEGASYRRISTGDARTGLRDWWSFGTDERGNDMGGGPTAKAGYELLWEAINGPDSWTANPWVWVVEFKVVTK